MTRVSRDGGGVRSARACVTMGPSCVHSTIVSPAWRHPFTRMTSSVAPRPSTTLTSRTVHWRLYEKASVVARRCCVSDRTTRRRSGTPSPVMADVGTTETVDAGSSFSQYRATFRACALSSAKHPSFLESNSARVFSAWLASASRTLAPSVGRQS